MRTIIVGYTRFRSVHCAGSEFGIVHRTKAAGLVDVHFSGSAAPRRCRPAEREKGISCRPSSQFFKDCRASSPKAHLCEFRRKEFFNTQPPFANNHETVRLAGTIHQMASPLILFVLLAGVSALPQTATPRFAATRSSGERVWTFNFPQTPLEIGIDGDKSYSLENKSKLAIRSYRLGCVRESGSFRD